jgi:TRAP transporter TAXI family solute receptor
MRKGYGFALLAIVVFVGFLFVGDGIAADEFTNLRFGTSSVGSTGYNWMAGFTSLINKYTNYQSTVIPSGGSSATVRAISRKEREFGFGAEYSVYTGYTGTAEFAKDGKQNVMLAAIAYDSIFVCPAKPGIRKVPDLKGKSFMYGRKPNPHWTNMGDAMLEVYGLTPDKDVKRLFSVETKEILDALKIGTVDAGLCAGAVRQSSIMELTEGGNYSFITLDQDKIAAIQKTHPYFSPAVIPAGTYKGQNEDIHSMSYFMCLFCRPDLPEKVVYDVVKSIFTHVDEFIAIVPAAKGGFSAERAARNPSVPVHPGAIKYYKEVGVWKQ